MNIKDNYFQNPILQGFYPDPSICRVEEDYYLINSSFAFFPGIPIFHSKDLINWKQIGHVLDRPSQLDLDGANLSGGIFAPTIKYQNGTFYVITTNMTYGGTFIVTSTNPKGPWSEPYWIDNAKGIDPSLFFDDDGKAYYIGTRHKEKEKYFGNHEIWIQEIDLLSMKLIGESKALWDGALKKSMFPEGPHIYKKDGYYYLMIAEGGTEDNHSITIARSREIMGEYKSNPANPILTHRHIGRKYYISNVGHGDLVETQNGEWFIVLLGSRLVNGHKPLARETFLAPVDWENGWPIISPGTGKIESLYKLPNLPISLLEKENDKDDFIGETLDFKWNMVRTPRNKYWSLSKRKSHLRLKLQKLSLLDKLKMPSFDVEKISSNRINIQDSPSFIGRRIQDVDFDVTVKIEFESESENEVAGIAIIQHDNHQFRFELSRDKDTGSKDIRVVLVTSKTNINFFEKSFNYENFETILNKENIANKEIILKVIVRENKYSFMYSEDNENFKLLLDNFSGNFLCSDVTGGFIGSYIGMYASSNGEESNNYADFDWFEYNGIL